MRAQAATSGRWSPFVHDAVVAAGYRYSLVELLGRPVHERRLVPSTPSASPSSAVPLRWSDRRIRTNRLSSTVVADAPIDLGGIAKGHTADLARAAALVAGATAASVVIGGDGAFGAATGRGRSTSKTPTIRPASSPSVRSRPAASRPAPRDGGGGSPTTASSAPPHRSAHGPQPRRRLRYCRRRHRRRGDGSPGRDPHQGPDPPSRRGGDGPRPAPRCRCRGHRRRRHGPTLWRTPEGGMSSHVWWYVARASGVSHGCSPRHRSSRGCCCRRSR